MRHDSMVSRYAIPTGIPKVDSWSTGPSGFGASQGYLEEDYPVPQRWVRSDANQSVSHV